MICNIHEIEMQLICYEYVCGSCYEERLHIEKAKAPYLPTLEWVYEESSHKKVLKKKKQN